MKRYMRDESDDGSGPNPFVDVAIHSSEAMRLACDPKEAMAAGAQVTLVKWQWIRDDGLTVGALGRRCWGGVLGTTTTSCKPA